MQCFLCQKATSWRKLKMLISCRSKTLGNAVFFRVKRLTPGGLVDCCRPSRSTVCWGCDGATSPFLAVSAVHLICTARFSHFFFTPYNFLPKATPWTARPSMRAGKKYDLTFMHSTARSFWGKATPDCSFSHQSITKIFDPTVIPNERARFFGIRARPRDPTQSVSSMRPLSPHSMMKKKSFGNGK